MGDMYTNPPQSRNEAILRATIDGTEYTDPPQSRMEDLLIELKEAIEEGGGSVESYEQLTNKPQINGTTLSGNKTTEGLIPIGDGLNINADGELETADAYIPTSEKGTASGVATLTEAGKVPEAQLPSYVDDAIEGYLYEGHFYADSAHTEEITGERGKIYVDLDTNRAYRWTGSTFVEIGDNNTFTANRALVSDANGKVSASSATSEEVGYLSGVTGAIQTQLDGKADENEATPVSVSGNPITITDAAKIPCESLSMTIEPIQSGSGTPSPTNVRPISGLTEANAGTHGKNYLPKGTTATIRGVTFTVNDDGTIKPTGTATGGDIYKIGDNFTLKSGHTYTISGNPINYGGSGTFMYGLVDASSDSWLAVDYGSGASYTPTEDINVYVAIRFWYGMNFTNLDITFSPQLEVGSTPTAYEPYTENTATITFGETVYGGNVDYNKGEANSILGDVDISTLNWTYTSSGYFYVYHASSKVNGQMLCEALEATTAQNVKDHSVANSIAKDPTNGNLIAYYTESTDPTAFKTAMSGVKLVYEKATPTTLTLTPAQLTLLKGYNTVSANGATINLDYQKYNLAGDIKKWVLQQIQG